jgi:hypothetical protein
MVQRELEHLAPVDPVEAFALLDLAAVTARAARRTSAVAS